MNCNSVRKSKVQRNNVCEIMDKLAIQYCTDNIRYFPYFGQLFVPAHIQILKDYNRHLVKRRLTTDMKILLSYFKTTKSFNLCLTFQMHQYVPVMRINLLVLLQMRVFQ